MKHFRFACILLTLSLAVAMAVPRRAMSTHEAGFTASGVSDASSSEALANSAQDEEELTARQPASTVIRTLAYHQITSFTAPGVMTGDHSPILSADGNRVAFSRTFDNVNHIYVVNADGTGLLEVDTYTPPGGTWAPQVDISADGSRVLSWDRDIARLVNADGTNPHQVIEIWGGFRDFRLSADGSRVFFVVDRDFQLAPSGEPRSAGLYVVNADRTGLRQIVNANQVAALFGKTPGEVPFSWSGVRFSVSRDGSRIVFQVGIRDVGYQLFRVNSDGTGLQAYSVFPAGYYWNIPNLGISGDGNTVFYEILPNPCCSTPAEIGVFNWDGTGRRMLASNYPGNGGFFSEVVQLSHDGSKLLHGSLGRLYNTDGSGVLQLAMRGGWYTTDPPLMVGDRMYRATMNSSATRFLYVIDYPSLPPQLATLDINPPGLGQSPSVTDPKIVPPYVLTGGRSAASVSARVSTSNTLNRVSNATLRNGLEDTKVGGTVMHDDGTQGDVTAGDGVFTNNAIRATSDAVVGPRTVRVKAEVRASDGKKHATAVEFGPFEAAVNPPTGVGTTEQPPTEFVLWQSYPNPFNPETAISFALPEAADVRITVSDMLGRELITLQEARLSPGYHTIRWGGVDGSGNMVASGIYFYRIRAVGESGKTFTKTMKMALTR